MKLTLAILLVLALTQFGSGRLIADIMMYDGMYNATAAAAATTTSASAQVPQFGASMVTCEPAYGFLPCTTELPGLIFLIVVYQYLLSLGQKYVSDGSDLFFKTYGPGSFGDSLFHLIGTIPQVALIIVSRLSGNAQAQAGIGISILAGGAVTNLTLTWGIAAVLASYKFSDAPATIDGSVPLKKPPGLTGSGVLTDVDTSITARIMLISVVPLLILQLTNVVGSSSGSHLIVLITLIVTLLLLFSYSLYQIFQPWIQERRFKYLTQKFVKDKLQVLLTNKGEPNIELIKQIFQGIDHNNDHVISPAELRTLIIGIKLEDDGFVRGDYADKVREAFDINNDTNINEDEFVNGLSQFLLDAQKPGNQNDLKVPNASTEENQSLLVQGTSTTSVEDPWKNYLNAAYLILLGITISVLLAKPLIQSVVGVATAAKIPSFFIPYVVIPLTLASRSAGRTIASAKLKTPESISLLLSQIYGSVFMSNLISLTTFLIVVYIRDIPVAATAEFLVAIVICTVMGVFASFRTAFPLWTSYLVILMYPTSLVTLYVLTSVLGWS